MLRVLRGLRSERDERVLEAHDHIPSKSPVAVLSTGGQRTEWRFCAVPNCNELLKGHWKGGMV